MGQITFKCQNCGWELTVGQHKAGKEGHCGNCGEIVVVPGGPETGADEAPGDEDIPEVQPLAEEEEAEAAPEEEVTPEPEIPEEREETVFPAESVTSESLEMPGEAEECAEDVDMKTGKEEAEEDKEITEAETVGEETPAAASQSKQTSASMEMEPPSEAMPFRTPGGDQESAACDEAEEPSEHSRWLPIGSVVSGAMGVATVWFWGIGTLFGTFAIGCYLYQGDRRRGWGLLGAVLGAVSLILGVCYAGWRVLTKS